MLLLHFGIVCLHGMVGLTIRTASDGLNLSLDHKIQLFSVGCICLFLCKKTCMKTLQVLCIYHIRKDNQYKFSRNAQSPRFIQTLFTCVYNSRA